MIGLSEDEKRAYRKNRIGKTTGSGGFDSKQLRMQEAEIQLQKEMQSIQGGFGDQLAAQSSPLMDTSVSNQAQMATSQSMGSALASTGATVLATEGGKMIAKETGKEVAKTAAKEGAKTAASAGLSAGASAGIGVAGKIGGDMIDDGGTSTSTGKGVAGGALKGAATGAAFGPWGAAIGGVVGGVTGALGAKANRRKAEAEAQAKMHRELGKIEGDKTERLNKALSGLASQFTSTLV